MRLCDSVFKPTMVRAEMWNFPTLTQRKICGVSELFHARNVSFETIVAAHRYVRYRIAAHDALGDAEAAAGALVSALGVSAPSEEGEVEELVVLSSKVLATLSGGEQVSVFFVPLRLGLHAGWRNTFWSQT